MILDKQGRMAGEQAAWVAPATRDFDQQIAQQDATIHAIEQRLVVASEPRPRFTLSALHNELAIEQELATARDERGALLYDRDFAKAAKA